MSQVLLRFCAMGYIIHKCAEYVQYFSGLS